MAQNLPTELAAKERLTFENAPDLAGAAMFSEAGTCREHAVVAMHLHANKLEGSTDTVHLASRPMVNHTWIELREQRKRRGAIVMDPWAEGSAVFSEDARHTRVSIGIRSDGHYDAATGARASERAELARQTLVRETPADTLDEIRSALADHPLPKRALFDAQPVVRAQADAERKFAAAQTGVRNEIKAIGIARSLGMANTVREAVGDAKAIVDAARNLERTDRADTLPDAPSNDDPRKQR